jgi:ParB family transcriptional regulator, chromosome partitioning protein
MSPTEKTEATKATKRKKVAIADASRSNIYNVDPANLVLVTDKKHALYDERVHLPIDEGMVKSIIAKGVIQPITIRKNGTLFEVVQGRQRVKNSIEANKRITADGGTPIKVPAVIRNEGDAAAAGTNNVTNYVLQSDDVITKAEKANDARMRFGKSDADLSVEFNVTINTIKTWAKLDTLVDVVKVAIKNEKISFHVAVDNLSDVTREDQGHALEKLIASAPAGKRGNKGGGNKDDEGGKKESPIARMRRFYRDEDAMAAVNPQTRTLVEWFFGQATHGDLVTSNGRLSNFVSSVAKKKITGKGKGKESK